MINNNNPSKTIDVINQKNIEILNPLTLSLIFVEIKKEIEIERKVRRELINNSSKVNFNPSVKFPKSRNGNIIPVRRLIIRGRLVPKNSPMYKALRGIG